MKHPLAWDTSHNLPNHPSEMFCAPGIDDLQSEDIIGHVFRDRALNRLGECYDDV